MQDDEVIAILHDGAIAERLASDLLDDIARSERMDPARFEQRSRWHRAQEAGIRVLRRFM